jgi:putative transposase
MELDFSWPGKPYIESFNGSFQDECLNTNWFFSLEDAMEKIENGGKDYDEWRPHSSIDNLTPASIVRNPSKNGDFSILTGTTLG